MYGFSSAGELRKLRKELEQVGAGGTCVGQRRTVMNSAAPLLCLMCPPPCVRPPEQKKGKVDLRVPGPKPPRQAGAAWDSRFNAWTFPFLGAWDKRGH